MAKALVVVCVMMLPGVCRAVTVDVLNLFSVRGVTLFEVTDFVARMRSFPTPDGYVLSDGTSTTHIAGTLRTSMPNLENVKVDGATVLAGFSPAPGFLFSVDVLLRTPRLAFTIEVGLVELFMSGKVGAATGTLFGSAQLLADEGSINATGAVGSLMPIFANIALLDGALFAADMFESPFEFQIDGSAAFLPEPGLTWILSLILAPIVLKRRSGIHQSRSGTQSKLPLSTV